METKFSLPCDVAELQKMDVDWKTLTNGFDYDTVKRIIELWKNYGERCMVARMIGSQMSVKNMAGVNADSIQPVLDLLNMHRYKEGSREYELMKELLQSHEEKYRREKRERLQEENKRLKTQVEKLKEDNSELQKQITQFNKTLLKSQRETESLSIEAKRWYDLYEQQDKHSDELLTRIIELENESTTITGENQKLKDENKLLREFLDKGGDQKFSVRQTTIIAYALCKKADVLPKNKKNISQMFSRLTGRSENTIGQNMCANYKDEEINQLAQEIESSMPEFANYLREKTFFLPQKKK